MVTSVCDMWVKSSMRGRQSESTNIKSSGYYWFYELLHIWATATDARQGQTANISTGLLDQNQFWFFWASSCSYVKKMCWQGQVGTEWHQNDYWIWCSVVIRDPKVKQKLTSWGKRSRCPYFKIWQIYWQGQAGGIPVNTLFIAQFILPCSFPPCPLLPRHCLYWLEFHLPNHFSSTIWR